MFVTTPVLWSPTIHINTRTSGEQYDPNLVSLKDGTFIAVWADNTGTAEGADIQGQFFHADGTKRSGEFTIPASSAGNQYDPVVTILNDGRFVVVWSHQSTTANDEDIKAQIFRPDGTRDGGEILINVNNQAGIQNDPSVSALPNGGFVVSFTDTNSNGDGSGSSVCTQAFDAYGNRLGHETRVNKTVTDNQYNSFVMGMSDSYIVFYDDESSSPDKPLPITIRGRIFSLEGQEKKTEFVLPVTNFAQTGGAQATVLKDGRYVVTWAASSSDGDGTGIRGQIFNADGSRYNGEFQVNKVTVGHQTMPSIVALHDGGFAIAYKSISPADNEFYLATFNAIGLHDGDTDLLIGRGQRLISDLGTKPEMAALADGRIVVSWQDTSDLPSDNLGGVYAQILDPRGQAVVLNGTSAADQYIGTVHNDRLNGASGDDVLTGETGNDVIDGGEGQDLMNGGAGDDTYWVDSSGDSILDASGFDTVISSINYALPAFIENLTASGYGAVTLTGNALNNTLTGNAAANILIGNEGSDVLIGGEGDDTYIVGEAGDRVVETASGGTADQIVSSISCTLAAYVERLTASGAASISLTGNDLANVITGNAGRNTIKGGAGLDQLTGGAGQDSFVFDTKLSSKLNKDKILDWSYKDDTIQLENAIFKSLKQTGTLNKASFVMGAKAKDGNDFIGYNKATGDLWYDTNGDKAGGQVVFAHIGKGKTIFHSDFVVI
jgi:Ca2+-binding RTX toxin-like protein